VLLDLLFGALVNLATAWVLANTSIHQCNQSNKKHQLLLEVFLNNENLFTPFRDTISLFILRNLVSCNSDAAKEKSAVL
jgi:hypothetical protein